MGGGQLRSHLVNGGAELANILSLIKSTSTPRVLVFHAISWCAQKRGKSLCVMDVM